MRAQWPRQLFGLIKTGHNDLRSRTGLITQGVNDLLCPESNPVSLWKTQNRLPTGLTGSLDGLLKVETFQEEYTQKQKMITVRVEGTGGGIPHEVFENIFNPFFTTKHTGTGLGLSICRKIIENHGGTIRVENQLGKGVIVYLHLPLQNSPDYYKN